MNRWMCSPAGWWRTWASRWRRRRTSASAIHNACEVYALNKEVPTDPTLLALFEPWRQWFDENVERIDCIEQVFVHHEHGYAGRVDMVALLKGDRAGRWWISKRRR